MQSMQEKKVLGSELSLHRGPKVGERMAHSRTQKHSRMAGEQQQQSRLPGWALRVFVARGGVAALPPTPSEAPLCGPVPSGFLCEFVSIPHYHGIHLTWSEILFFIYF